jgi:arylsulfatase A-like enzyme
MQKLDEWDLWQDTLVIFMTDNGQAGRNAKRNGERVQVFTAGFKTGKGSPYEGGTHVPAFWRWQGVLGEGVDIPALTAHIDIFPTFCELAGIEIPGDIQPLDGSSLLPLLENPKADWPDRFLFVHQGRWPKGEDPNRSKFKNCAVRSQRWRWVNNQELYDIQADPYESTNVADQHPDVVQTLRTAYDDWWSATLPWLVNEDVPYAQEHPQDVRYYKQLQNRGIPEWTPPSL